MPTSLLRKALRSSAAALTGASVLTATHKSTALLSSNFSNLISIRSYITTKKWAEKETFDDVIGGSSSSYNAIVDGGGNITPPNTTNPQQITTLNFIDHKNWNTQQVVSVLTSSESVGGAGLSIVRLKPLCDAGIDGVVLGNIVTNIEKKQGDEEYAINQLKNIFKDGGVTMTVKLASTCHAIVTWVLTQMTKQQQLQEFEKLKLNLNLNPAIKQARTDPKYDYLRNLDDPNKMSKLESLIGTNIELPILGPSSSIFVPNEYNPQLPYLLTRQQFMILKQVVTGEKIGFVFSGPHGISKSYTLLLIACYALVNSFPLLYVPKCANLVGSYRVNGKEGAEEFLRNSVYYWNYDIIECVDFLKSKNVVTYLSRAMDQNRPTFFLFGEHNELFKGSGTESYFNRFKTWSSDTGGHNTMTIYCGNSHSLFENRLPGGEESKLIFFTPPNSSDEFKTLVTNFGLNPNDKRIEFSTGRIPRELKIFAERLQGKAISDEFVVEFFNYRVGKFLDRIEQLPEDQKQKLSSTLDKLFSLGLGSGRPAVVSGCCYDQGLMFRDPDNLLLYTINNAATSALWSFYCQYNVDVFLNMRNVFPKSVRGGLMEYGLKFLEGTRSKKNITYHKILCDVQNGPFKREVVDEIISYGVNLPIGFSRSNLASLFYDNFLATTTVLVLPETETDNFPCFDYIIIEYAKNNIKLYFKQVTTLTVDEQYWDEEKKTFAYFKLLFTRNYVVKNNYKASQPKTLSKIPESNRFSLLEIILHSVTKSFAYSPNVKRYCHRVFSYGDEFTTKNNTGSYSKLKETVVIGNFTVTWKFIYESGVETTKQRVDKVVHSGVLYRNKEEIGLI